MLVVLVKAKMVNSLTLSSTRTAVVTACTHAILHFIGGVCGIWKPRAKPELSQVPMRCMSDLNCDTWLTRCSQLSCAVWMPKLA